jgi:hypothetical protein
MIDKSLIEGRELTFDERATWGNCLVCGAEHGEWCHAEIGVQLGSTIGGGRLKTGQGAHMGRIQAAPHKVKLQAAH